MDNPSDRFFLDTGYVLARFNRRDQYHARAKSLANLIAAGRELWTSDAVLLEVFAAFSDPSRRAIALSLWDDFHGRNPRCKSCPAAGPQLDEAVILFRSRPDKSWSLTDSLSFVVMKEQSLTEALSADHHFVQAGFRALLLESA